MRKKCNHLDVERVEAPEVDEDDHVGPEVPEHLGDDSAHKVMLIISIIATQIHILTLQGSVGKSKYGGRSLRTH
jgi:hypothetical protein